MAGVPADESSSTATPDVITVRTFRLTRVFKGDMRAGSTLEVKQLGGELGGVVYVEEDAVPLDPSAGKYILFLQTYPDAAASLLNPWQGQYFLEAGDRVRSLHGNPVRFTIADLRRQAG